MFSKKDGEKLEALIGANTSFKGDIATKGTLRIDGTLEGNAQADWLIIGEKGRMAGNAAARGVIVGGKLEGNITAKETVEIKAKGNVHGDVYTPKLSVMEGGLINGRTNMGHTDGKIVEIASGKKG
jgi:cytoskeletal protein CcmA (bactofilin family)